MFLRQSTALILKFGAFVDDSDGSTPETGLTITQADIQISKVGGAFAQTSEGSPTTTHDVDGWYLIPLTTTDTDTLGTLDVQITKSGALPVWRHFEVITQDAYDALFHATNGDLRTANAADVAFIKNVTEGDISFDKTVTPWQLVVKIKGTSTELIRKDLTDITGVDLTAINTIIGGVTEP